MITPVICFIDDSAFEHDLVENQIAPCDTGLDFIQAFTFEEAGKALREKLPGLFLLDLWGRDQDLAQPYLTPKKTLEKKIARFVTLEDVYAGLDDFKGDVTNEFLKRLFAIVDCWRSTFEEVCAKLGQNRKYGLSNLHLVREYYPGVPAVFYTRKSLISDAVAIFQAGADGLFIKPTGPDDAETRRLTREYAPELIKGLKTIMASGIGTGREASDTDM